MPAHDLDALPAAQPLTPGSSDRRFGVETRRYAWPAFRAAITVLLTIGIANAAAQCVLDLNGRTLCPPPESRCAVDRYGAWFCSPPGGDALQDRYGNVVCGPGRCTSEPDGRAWCSTKPNGGAAQDRYGKAVCTDGCILAAQATCQRLSR